MSGLWVLLLLIFVSAIPAIAVFMWFRAARYPFSLTRFLISLLAGAAAFFPALILQNIFPAGGDVFSARKWTLFARGFVRVAMTEELSRFVILALLFYITGYFEKENSFKAKTDNSVPALSYGAVIRGTAVGLVAGLGFAILESAAYAASDAGIALLRVFTTAPLHAACGSRVGGSAALFLTNPVQAVFRFFSAVAIHSIYNYMVVLPGFPGIAAILIALSTLASSVLSIRGGMSTPEP
jgi:RsiW-degrading membrane proteinase PrsW (M82 family)